MIPWRKLDRYVMAEFLKVLGLALFALTVIYVLIHLMDHIDVYLDHDAPWAAVGRYYLYSTPYNLVVTLPMAMLIASILSIGEMGRHGELTAMKSSGISLYRIVWPLILFGIVTSVGVLWFSETQVPEFNQRAEDVYHQGILGVHEEDRENYRGNFVYQNSDGYTYIVRSLFVQPAGATGEQIEIQKETKDGAFLRINAPQMVWQDSTGSWVLRNGELRIFPGARASPDSVPDSLSFPGAQEQMYGFSLLRSPALDDTPQELLAEEKDADEMGYADLKAYIAERERLGAETRKERVDLQMKLAYPFANLIILVFGVALVGSAAHASRQSATVGFGLALFLTIVFWGFLRVGQGIGYGGGLPPWAAAWLANGVFGFFALVLLSRART